MTLAYIFKVNNFKRFEIVRSSYNSLGQLFAIEVCHYAYVVHCELDINFQGQHFETINKKWRASEKCLM